MSRRQEPRIIDPHTHPRRYVSVKVASLYLEIDPRLLRKYLDVGTLPSHAVGTRRRIAVADLIRFERSLSVFPVKQQSAHTHT